MERMNKRAQGLSLTTIILIVLGLAVLVFLIFGFSKGWGNLWDTASQVGGGDSNVDDVRRGCTLACDTRGVDAFCNEDRTMRFGQKRNITWVNDTVVEEQTSIKGTCRFMANNFTDLNVGKCATLC